MLQAMAKYVTRLAFLMIPKYGAWCLKTYPLSVCGFEPCAELLYVGSTCGSTSMDVSLRLHIDVVVAFARYFYGLKVHPLSPLLWDFVGISFGESHILLAC